MRIFTPYCPAHFYRHLYLFAEYCSRANKMMMMMMICSVDALVNRAGGVGTYTSHFHSFALCRRPTPRGASRTLD